MSTNFDREIEVYNLDIIWRSLKLFWRKSPLFWIYPKNKKPWITQPDLKNTNFVLYIMQPLRGVCNPNFAQARQQPDSVHPVSLNFIKF